MRRACEVDRVVIQVILGRPGGEPIPGTGQIDPKPIRVDDTHVIYPRNTEYEIGRVGDKRLLAEGTVRQALTLSQHTRDGSSAYGLHWQIFKRREGGFGLEAGGLPVFGHGGSDGTLAIADPKRDLIVCYFTQSRGGRTVGRMTRLVREALQ